MVVNQGEKGGRRGSRGQRLRMGGFPLQLALTTTGLCPPDLDESSTREAGAGLDLARKLPEEGAAVAQCARRSGHWRPM